MSKSGKLLGKSASVDHPVVQKKIEKSLKLSIEEGSLASAATGLDISYFSPYALAMNATSSEVGVLYAVLNLVPALVQLTGPKIVSKFSRKKIVLTAVFVKLILLLPIILTGVLFFIGVPHMVWVFIGLVGLFYACIALGQPAWFSWMGSLVSPESRGRYFSKRNRIAGFFGLLAMILGAVILDGFKKIGGFRGQVLGFTLVGFGVLFVISIVARSGCFAILAHQYEPRLKVRKRDYFSFWQFLKRARETPFGRFVLFRGFFSVAIGIAAPFWAVYMLRDLGFSYVWFMAITVSGTLFQLVFLPLLGKATDKFGNVKIMSICSGLAFIIPLAWIASSLIPNNIFLKLYLLFVPHIFSGFVWAGYNLSTNNYVYDAVKSQKRGIGLSYMNLIVGVGAFAGAGIGSLIALWNFSFMNTLLFIFLVSAFARFVVASAGLRYLREVRHVSRFQNDYFIREFAPMRGAVREFHNLEHMVDKVEHYIKPGEGFIRENSLPVNRVS